MSQTDANAFVVYVEHAGDFVVLLKAVHRIHDGKVILDAERIDKSLRQAIAHTRVEPGA